MDAFRRLSTTFRDSAHLYGCGTTNFLKVYNKVVSGAQQAGGLKYKIFKWAVGLGKEVSKLRQNGQEPSGLLALKFSIADKLVFSKLRARFGGRIRYFISGSAPLNRDIAEFFHAAGLLILEGYGLTESSAASFVNRPDQNKFGTVGPAMPGTELRIAESDGEILIKSRGIMRGYYNKPDITADTLVDGWLHTGDIGEVDADGHLKITDRKLECQQSGGKYVSPSAVEGGLKPFVQSSARWSSMETVATTAPLSSRWMQRASLLGPKIMASRAPSGTC